MVDICFETYFPYFWKEVGNFLKNLLNTNKIMQYQLYWWVSFMVDIDLRLFYPFLLFLGIIFQIKYIFRGCSFNEAHPLGGPHLEVKKYFFFVSDVCPEKVWNLSN